MHFTYCCTIYRFFYTETLWVFFVFLSIWLTYVSLEKKRRIYYVITGISFDYLFYHDLHRFRWLLTLILYFSKRNNKARDKYRYEFRYKYRDKCRYRNKYRYRDKDKTDLKAGFKDKLKINWKLVFVPTAIVVVSMFLTILHGP